MASYDSYLSVDVLELSKGKHFQCRQFSLEKEKQMAISSKLHLVPVLKGAIDPRAGIVLRTYYIRPERLQKMIQEAREVPSKSYIVKIPHYDAISTRINTGNILPLYSAFTKNGNNDKAWGAVVNRHESAKTTLSENHYRQMLGQNLYAFLLTNDKLQLKTIPTMTKNASVTKVLTVVSTEKPAKPKLKRSKVREQFNLKTTSDPFALNNNEAMNPDYGIEVKYKQKLYTVNDGKTVAHYLSNMINFLNMNPAKVKATVASLLSSTSLNDKYNVVKHLVLRSSIYTKEAAFWSAVLQKLIPETDDPDSNLYQTLVLQRLDKDAVKLLRKSGLLPSTVIEILNSKNLEHLQDPLVAASLTQNEIQTILKEHPEVVNEKNVAALMLDVGSDIAYALIRKFMPDIFNPARLINDAIEENLESPAYYLLQMAVSHTYNLEYIPYVEFLKLKKLTFTPMIATKIYQQYWRMQGEALKQYIANTQAEVQQLPETIEVGLHTPKVVPTDYQYFIRLKPAQTLELYNKDAHNIKLKIKRESVFAVQGNKLLVFDPIDAIIDTEQIEELSD